MGKMSALLVSALLLWPPAGWLGYMMVTAILESSDKLQGNLFIFSIVTLVACAGMVISPILAFMFTGAVAAPAKSSRKDDDDESDGLLDEQFGDDDDELNTLDADEESAGLESGASEEFETVEFESDEFGDLDESDEFGSLDAFDDDDDEEDPFK